MMTEISNILKDGNNASSKSKAALEADTAAFLTVMADTCTEQEFSKIMESRTELAAYGLIDLKALESLVNVSEEPATEGMTSHTVVKFDKMDTLNRLEKRDCILLAKRDNYSAFTKYKKYRDLMKQQRELIYHRYATKATALAKKQLLAMRNKTSAMNSSVGKSVGDKIDTAIQHTDLNHDK